MNIPNSLSLLRVLPLPFVVIAMRSGQDAWLLALMLAGSAETAMKHMWEMIDENSIAGN